MVKNRGGQKGYWVIGRHAVMAVLRHQQKRVRALWVSNQDKYPDIIKQSMVKLHQCSDDDLTDLVGTDAHQGVAADCEPPSFSLDSLHTLIEKRGNQFLMLVLDKIHDPSNLGACLRTALAMGVDAVVLSKQSCAAITPVVTKTSCGASEIIPIVIVSNLVQAIKKWQDIGVWFFATSEHANQSIYAMDHTPLAKALVMGNEQVGVGKLLLKTCDYQMVIPTSSLMPSLNVSVATAIALSEMTRNKHLKTEK